MITTFQVIYKYFGVQIPGNESSITPLKPWRTYTENLKCCDNTHGLTTEQN